MAFTLPQVEVLMPTKKPRGEELTREQQRANQALNQRRLRIEHVNSSVKRCRIVKDRIRLWKKGVQRRRITSKFKRVWIVNGTSCCR